MAHASNEALASSAMDSMKTQLGELMNPLHKERKFLSRPLPSSYQHLFEWGRLTEPTVPDARLRRVDFPGSARFSKIDDFWKTNHNYPTFDSNCVAFAASGSLNSLWLVLFKTRVAAEHPMLSLTRWESAPDDRQHSRLEHT